MKKLMLPLTHKDIAGLRSGQSLLLSGKVYTARDAAHKKLFGLLNKKAKLPFPLKGAVIYYAGPTPARPGRIIGSCGPTTSARMDRFTPAMLKAGVSVMIGKGRRSEAVRKAIKKYKAVYFLAPAGCGALLSRRIRKKHTVAFSELGPEAVYELEITDFPVVVGIDAMGRDFFRRS